MLLILMINFYDFFLRVRIATIPLYWYSSSILIYLQTKIIITEFRKLKVQSLHSLRFSFMDKNEKFQICNDRHMHSS